MTLPKYAYFQGKIVPYSEAKVGIMTHALHYGTAAFAGIRAYWNDKQEQLYVFRPIDHFLRLLNSAKLLIAKIDKSPEELRDIVLDLLRKEEHRQDVYIRPLIYKAEEIVGVKLHDIRDDLCIYSVPFGRYVEKDEGAHVTFSSWRRIDDNAIPARGKISGAYVNSALVKTDALRSGFDEALVLTNEGHVSEGSAENVFMVRNGVLITPPVTENILEGITRRSIIQLAREELDIRVDERPIDRTEVYLCDEFFMTGTAAQVTAITLVDHHPIASGKMGPITSQLKTLYTDVVHGDVKKYHHWTQPVYEK